VAIALVLLAGALLDIAQFFNRAEPTERVGATSAAGGQPAAEPLADHEAGTSTLNAASGVAPQSYTVVRGDRLYDIALRHGTTVHALATLNAIEYPDRIDVGQVLVLPELRDAAGRE
jgi:LysM repeat protein